MLKQIIATLIVFLALTGCAGEEQTNASHEKVALEDLGPAPELNNETWLNTDQPLRLENLRGKVILLDMWTFG